MARRHADVGPKILFGVPSVLAMLILDDGHKVIARGLFRRHPEKFRSAVR
jgi:hypothetical protein